MDTGDRQTDIDAHADCQIQIELLAGLFWTADHVVQRVAACGETRDFRGGEDIFVASEDLFSVSLQQFGGVQLAQDSRM